MTAGESVRGAVVRLCRVTGDRRHRRRLAELGFVPGVEMSVLGRGMYGGLVLALGDGRFAVDAKTAATLEVEPADG